MFRVQYYDLKKNYSSESQEFYHVHCAESLARKLETMTHRFANVEVVGSSWRQGEYDGPYKSRVRF